ncbi:hypothetical protein F1_00055 [Ralstonia phage Heva]|uniref:Scaffolding protein n=2 Tax=Cimandefvirus TaxID=2843366 RepID=A0A7G5BAU5_9CAUD|nr:hypothetical protein KMC44_gp34 [Ralstonia phage Cimandef]YP_010078525.1 hypothetical protein KMC48_gp35 [Ralstonia phage Heva]QMV32681.1 hypothetical protein B2_00047 [Ralstonia phage Cimandef]QMV33418.1 hypothetical protein F1_00055 [Ralstonia phage Heva]
MTTKHSDELLDGLTPEELAALNDDDGAGAGGEDGGAGGDDGAGTGADDGAGAAAGGQGGEGDAGAGEGGDAGAGAGGDAGGKGAGGEGGEGDGGGDDGAVDTGTKSMPVYVAEAPEDAEAKLKGLADKRADLRKQYDDGDITFDELESARDEITKEEKAIERAQLKAEMAAEMQQQQTINDWNRDVNSFLDANPEYRASDVRYQALDMMVRKIGGAPEAAKMTGPQVLAKAHEELQKAFGVAAPAKKDEGNGKGEKKPPPKVDVPPTLGKLPAAESNDTNGGKYAALDRLLETDPLAHEDALMKISASERESYLASR